MSEIITHETIQNESHRPVTALARHIHHILDNGGNKETLLCNYRKLDVSHCIPNEICSQSVSKNPRTTQERHRSRSRRSPLPASRRCNGTEAPRSLRHHYQETRMLDPNDILTIHPQPNSTPLQRPINKNEHKPDIHQRH